MLLEEDYLFVVMVDIFKVFSVFKMWGKEVL